MTRAPISSRELPAPWGVCDVCGRVAGLSDPDGRGHSYLCASCAVPRILLSAAQHDLEALTAPVIGAWAAHWTGGGLNLKQLEGVIEWASGAWMNSRARPTFLSTRLRFLRRRYAAPAYFVEAPTRQTFAPDALARVVAFHPADGQHYTWPTFETADGKRHTPPRGQDAVILEAADGSRTVVFTGRAGRLSFERPSRSDPPGFHVPPALWPAFNTALSGEEKDLPVFAVYMRGQS